MLSSCINSSITCFTPGKSLAAHFQEHFNMFSWSVSVTWHGQAVGGSKINSLPSRSYKHTHTQKKKKRKKGKRDWRYCLLFLYWISLLKNPTRFASFCCGLFHTASPQSLAVSKNVYIFVLTP